MLPTLPVETVGTVGLPPHRTWEADDHRRAAFLHSRIGVADPCLDLGHGHGPCPDRGLDLGPATVVSRLWPSDLLIRIDVFPNYSSDRSTEFCGVLWILACSCPFDQELHDSYRWRTS